MADSLFFRGKTKCKEPLCDTSNMLRVGPSSARVIGGTHATAPNISYFFSLQTKSAGRHTCGAVRMSAQWLITAAHCIPSDTFTMLIDAPRASKACWPLQDGVVAVRMHPQYRSDDVTRHDIAMLRLERRPDAAAYGAACFAAWEPSITGAAPAHALLLGLGQGSGGVLSQAVLPTMPRAECESAWNMHPGRLACHWCAGNSSVDACYGDSGGPLLTADDERRLLGLVSFGTTDGCASARFPSVFTDVACYADWVGGYVRANQSFACECTSSGASDGVAVATAGGESGWCYVRGGLRCMRARPSYVYPGAAWRSLDAWEAPARPWGQRAAVLFAFVGTGVVLASYATAPVAPKKGDATELEPASLAA